MATDAKIKVNADFSTIKRGISEIVRTVQDLPKKQAIALFDKESVNFLKGAAKQALQDMKQQMDSLKAKAVELNRELKTEKTSTDEIKRKRLELINTYKEQSKLQREINDLSEKAKDINRSGMGAGLLQGLSKIPMVGKMAGLLTSGIGLGAMAGLGLGAGVAGAGMYAYGRGKEGYDQYREGIGSRIMLRGRGINEVGGINAGLGRLGYAPEDIRQAQLQSADIFGSGRSGTGDIYGRAVAAKNLGVGLSQFQGAGAGLRAQLGTEQGSRAFATLQANLMTKGLTDAIGPYLETAASMLTELNENGMGFDKGALDALKNIVATGTSPERAAAVLMGVNQRIQGSSGGQNAFFQSAFGAAGMGGGTLGGTREATQIGMFGLDPEKARQLLGRRQFEMYRRMNLVGGPGHLQQFLRGVSSVLPTFGGGEGGMLAQNTFLQKMFGGKSGAEAREIFNFLQSAGKQGKSEKQIQKEMVEQFGTPEEKVAAQLGELKQLNEIIGESVAPAVTMTNDVLRSIDRAVIGIAQKMGIAMPESPMEFRGRALQNVGLDETKLAQMTPDDLRNNYIRNQGKLGMVEAQRADNIDRYGQKVGGVMNLKSDDAVKLLQELVKIEAEKLHHTKGIHNETKKAKGGVVGRKSTTNPY